jgi:hypothetical protein
MKISATHKTTGELVEFDVTNLTELVSAWRTVQEYEKLATNLKDQLKKLLRQYINEDGKSDEVDGYRFTTTFVQRKNYDKAVMRQVLDEDTFDLLLIPHKTKVDEYLKEHLNELGEASTMLRESMISEGRGYSVTKLEKLS